MDDAKTYDMKSPHFAVRLTVFLSESQIRKLDALAVSSGYEDAEFMAQLYIKEGLAGEADLPVSDDPLPVVVERIEQGRYGEADDDDDEGWGGMVEKT